MVYTLGEKLVPNHRSHPKHILPNWCVLCNTNSPPPTPHPPLSALQRTSTLLVFLPSTHPAPANPRVWAMNTAWLFLKAQGPVELAAKVYEFLRRSLCHGVSVLYLLHTNTRRRARRVHRVYSAFTGCVCDAGVTAGRETWNVSADTSRHTHVFMYSWYVSVAHTHTHKYIYACISYF